jgi:hypothetical protein
MLYDYINNSFKILGFYLIKVNRFIVFVIILIEIEIMISSALEENHTRLAYPVN